MKKSLSLLLVMALCVLCAGTMFAQATANQTVNIAVNSVQKIAITGSPITLTITNGVAGTDALTPVTDATSTYSITHNSATALRITANLDAALAAGYQLQINLSPSAGHGTTAGTVDISNALAASAVNVVSAIPKGADAARTITYTFSANASAGALTSTAKTVTLTLTN
ncbi:MAG TPA: hypothetical protein VML00_11815 [Bacteroidota bacterium]|nr:hypothetical protein [Bacteroidota bacterium]